MNTLMKNSLRILGLLLIVSLAACSDNDNDRDSNDGDAGNTGPLANGVWIGKVTMDSGESIGDIVGVLYDGKIMFIDEDDGPTETMVDGTYELDGNEIFGTALMYEDIEGESGIGDLNREPELSFSGTVIEGESISLSFDTEDGGSGTIEFTLAPDYNEPSSLSFIEGSWGYRDLIITVLDTGEFHGVADSGCVVSGTISILDSEISLYKAVTTIEDCGEVNGVYDGFSGVNTDDVPNVLTIIGANPEYFLAFDLDRL